MNQLFKAKYVQQWFCDHFSTRSVYWQKNAKWDNNGGWLYLVWVRSSDLRSVPLLLFL